MIGWLFLLLIYARRKLRRHRAMSAYRHANARAFALYSQHRAIGTELLKALQAERAAGERMEAVLSSEK
ncbi:hypothetical protein GTP58_24580 [Duganella sp. CY15W]|uniref:hypothetical protein n=1 Tax=Duganella sp. CY15W TaxID=2692172 RepID=UPI00136A05E8|nr:hypothetical protein [Duganella sp. CY15W]MYM31514.1 hypothetical protein [Duganella sp. CY15W]